MGRVQGEGLLIRRVVCGSAVTATAMIYTPPAWALVLAGLTVWPVALLEFSSARRRLRELSCPGPLAA
jgi:hypothetical protein